MEVMILDEADEFIEEHLASLPNKYQTALETSMESDDFIFDCVKTRQIIYRFSRLNRTQKGNNKSYKQCAVTHNLL